MDSLAPNSSAAPAAVPVKRQAAIRLARTGGLEELRRLADAGDPQACRQLAVALTRAGRIDEVEARAAGGDRYACRALADWLVRHGRFDEAIDQMQVVAESGNAGACRRLARLLAGQGRVEEAIAQLQRAPGPDQSLTMCRWLASQGRYDLLRQLAATGNPCATAELRYAVSKLWNARRLAAAIDLLTDLDPGDTRDGNLDRVLVYVASRWRSGRHHLRDEAIDVLGTSPHPTARRARAGVLLEQGRYDEAVAELRSLAVAGDHDAGASLEVLLRAEKPAREFRALEYCAGNLRAVVFSSDGTMIATCDGNDHTIVVWNLETDQHLHTLYTPGFVGAVAFSDDSTLLAGNGWGGVRIWNAATGEHLRDMGTDSKDYITGVAFIDDCTLVAGRTVWDLTTGACLLVLDGVHGGWGAASAVGPGNQMLAIGATTSNNDRNRGWNPTVQLWNLATGQHLHDLHIEQRTSLRSLAVSPDGRLLAVACDAGVWLSDLVEVQIHQLGDRGAKAVAFHPDRHLLVTARPKIWSESGVRLWNPETGTTVDELNTPADAVAFSSDGAFLATADEASGLVRLWNNFE